MTIDFLTTIIDNYGDAGFAFNLALALQYEHPNIKVRFFCDNQGLFLKLKGSLHTTNIEYFDLKEFEKHTPSPTIFNFFDRKINFEFLHQFPFPITLINFTYFLMHLGVRSLHHTHYLSKNVSVTHYIPSLLPEGGGVIIHPEIRRYAIEMQQNRTIEERRICFPDFPHHVLEKKWVSLFCYPDTFENIFEHIMEDTQSLYFVFDYTKTAKNIINMPFMDILSYQKFLFLCDKNIVRGENSLVGALLAGKPFLWDIYKEHNGAHREKVNDFNMYLAQYTNIGDDYQNIFKNFNLSGDEKYTYLHKFLDTDYKNVFSQFQEQIMGRNNLCTHISKYF